MIPFDEDRPLAQLLGDSFAQLAKLVQNEIDLARAELRQKVALAGGAFKLMAVGAALVIPALVLILMAVAAELIQLGLSPPLAYLFTGVAAAVLAGLVAWAGASRLSGDSLAPSATLAEFRRDKTLAKEVMR